MVSCRSTVIIIIQCTCISHDQMQDIFEEIPFDNRNGGVWDQGFDISYSMEAFATEPLSVFVVPHSHNDPGKLPPPPPPSLSLPVSLPPSLSVCVCVDCAACLPPQPRLDKDL